MPRKPSDTVTATVSICVDETEHEAIRNAAHAASLSVSSWAASRLAATLAHRDAVTAVGEAAARIASSNAPRGSRKARVSMVLREHDKQAMDKVAGRLAIKPHAYAQAAVIAASADELGKLPAPQRRILEEQRKAASAAASSLVDLPKDLADADPEALAAWLRKLVDGTAAAILDGKGRTIADGVTRMMVGLHGTPMVVVRVAIPEFELQAPAHVLGVPWKAYATALAVKAARAMREA